MASIRVKGSGGAKASRNKVYSYVSVLPCVTDLHAVHTTHDNCCSLPHQGTNFIFFPLLQKKMSICHFKYYKRPLHVNCTYS